MTRPAITVLVIAKQPVPGRVKTRLVPPCTHEQAAALAEAALTDTLHTVLTVPASHRVLVLDGEPGPWLPPGFDVVPQCGGLLDERLAAAFAAVRGPALLSLNLADRRFGYPLEMVMNAAAAGWRVSEVEVAYLPRIGKSKVTGTVRGCVRTVRDMSQVLAQ